MQEYISAVNDLKLKKQEEKFEALQIEAASKKSYVLDMYRQKFPKLWEYYGTAFENAEPVFLNNDKSDVGLSGYGAPGVLVEGFIFAVYTNSYCQTYYVGIYNGKEPVKHGGSILSDRLNADDHMAKLLDTLMNLKKLT